MQSLGNLLNESNQFIKEAICDANLPLRALRINKNVHLATSISEVGHKCWALIPSKGVGWA